ncbi:MAG: hypothetical protein KME57_20185 [Scytonema hyalinum WJT4-NPBG1]|jgi:hypothetical protein|nr:hypothetical protein [Scytonema hyalinum WJT4-NPBG1]
MLSKNHYLKFAIGALLLPGLLGFETAIAKMPKEVENPPQAKEELLVQDFQNTNTKKQNKIRRRCVIVRRRVGRRILTHWKCYYYRL